MRKRPYIFARATEAKHRKLVITAEERDGKALIRITGFIFGWNSNSAEELRRKVDMLIAAGHKDCNVYINTKGGETMEASEIFNVLRTFKGKLIAEGGALVASAGTYISSKCDKFRIHGNTQFMYHKPMGGFEGTVEEIENNLKLLRDVEADYLAVYSKKTGKKKEEIAKQWAKGDQWLLGQEIIDAGFADEIINDAVEITEEDVEELVAVGAPVVPVATAKKIVTNQNDDTMKINPTLIGLAADATEAQIEARLKELQSKETQVTALQKEANDKSAADKVAAIKAVLDTAQKENKITAETRPHFEKLLNAEFESGKAVIASLPVVPKLSAVVKTGTEAGGEDRSKWTYADYQQKDPVALAKMHDDEPEAHDALFDAHKSSLTKKPKSF